MSARDFEFFIGGIEDEILRILEAEMKPMGVMNFAAYAGELDAESVKKTISSITAKFPLILVAYTDGLDKQDPPVSAIFGESRIYEHECCFAVICAANDPRGGDAQRRGALVGDKKIGTYKMLAKVRQVLSDLQLTITDGGDEVLLNTTPLMPSATQVIARLPNMTAYAQIFDTEFIWQTEDRSQAGTPVEAVIADVDLLPLPGEGETATHETPIENLPGVTNE
jgi:phage gp37-like protein